MIDDLPELPEKKNSMLLVLAFFQCVEGSCIENLLQIEYLYRKIINVFNKIIYVFNKTHVYSIGETYFGTK